MEKAIMISIFFLMGVVPFEDCLAQAGIVLPEKGETVENQQAFPVFLDVQNLDPSANYWIAIATVKGYSQSKARVLELYGRQENEAAKAELLKLLSELQINLFWPKFPVDRASFSGDVYDGGNSPMEPQPMILLLLKVSDTLDQRFSRWLTDCEEGKGCPGLPSALLRNNMILARNEIFFPKRDR